MRKFCALFVVLMLVSPAAADLTVNVGESTEPWTGYMNVFELDGTTFVFGQPWGVPDLTATFDDPNNTLTLGPTPIADADPFWYIGGGGPGAPGNKIMNAVLYQEFPQGALAGETLTFQGNILSNTFTEHTSVAFVRDFAPDFSSFFEATVPVAPGPFSVSLALDPGPDRHVQFGFATTGVNVWPTDVDLFGTAVIGTVGGAPIPTVSEWGLIIMALLLGVAALRIFGRRPATETA